MVQTQTQTFIVLATVATLVVMSSASRPFIVAFGDSNTDTGSGNAAYGVVPTFPNSLGDRSSNGKLIIDFLCDNIKTDYLKGFLNAFGQSSFSSGVNFAVAGAATSDHHFFWLNNQVSQFVRFWNLMKGSEEDLKEALYLIDIGQNDLTYAFPASANMTATATQAVSNIRKAVEAIYTQGGRKFWIHNTGPLGCLPTSVANHKVNATLDEIGCIEKMNEVSQMFNQYLSTACEQLRAEKKDSIIVYVDVYAIKYNLIANATDYGFENPFTACFQNIGNQSYVCEDQSKHTSWDGTHYTEAANSFVASKIVTGHYSTPPLPFNFFV